MKKQRQFDSQITVAEVVDLLWPQIAGPGERRREVASRIRNWLTYDLEVGKVSNSRNDLTLKGRSFDRVEVLLRAREKWPERLMTPPLAVSADSSTQAVIASVVEADVIPGTLERCQRRLIEVLEEVERLRTELGRATQQLAELKPQADAYLQFKKRSGRRGKPA